MYYSYYSNTKRVSCRNALFTSSWWMGQEREMAREGTVRMGVA
jgi:hypothetical protein